MRFFNTAGPVNPEDHYRVPPLERLELDELLMLIEQKKYFVLHAPRQTGKTSCLFALRDYLNARDDYHCVYVNVEMGQTAREDVKRGMRAVLGELAAQALSTLGDETLTRCWQELLEQRGEDSALNAALSVWARTSPKPLVVMLDEIDALVGDTLISVLRQLRAGYAGRPREFPLSIILCGVRDVRDYRIYSSNERAIITGGSAFNIKTKSLRLGDFNRSEMDSLYRQHTDETGQVIEPDALERIWALTQGQPWLTNALGDQVCFEMKSNRDRARAITAAMVDEAKEKLILRRETHLDQLVDKLQEERVRRVIEPLLSGDEQAERIPADDIQYVRDLGLIRTDRQLRIANPIYREVIPRELIYSETLTIAQESAWYLDADGRLNLTKLLTAFQQFFREHSEHWVERFQYKEAGPQLLMQAFLQRIVNGGGRIEREYGLGRRRTDLLVIWPRQGAVQKAVIELKILHKSMKLTIAEGLEQTWEYLDRSGAEEGHLVIFDRTAGKSWEEKLFEREELVREKIVKVWGM